MAYSQEIARSLLSGPLADRPLASVGRYWYFADDEDGGTLYKSDGSTWRQVALGASASSPVPTGTGFTHITAGAQDAASKLVEIADVATSLKPSGTATGTDESLRRLGTGSTHAAAGDDTRFPTAGEKNALAGTSGTPGTTNKYVTDGDSRMTDARTPTAHVHSGGDITTGTVAEARIDSAIARDSEVTSAISALSSVYQPLDSDLTAVAGLTPTNDDVVQRKAGAWTNRSIAQLLTDLAAPGTTFQPLDATLTALAGLATGANKVPYSTGTDTFSQLGTDQLTGIAAGVLWTVVTKASDENNASNTTLQADDELFFTAASGAVYEFEATIKYLEAAGAPNIKIGFGEDGTIRGHYTAFGRSTSGGQTNQVQVAANNQSVAFGALTTALAIRVFGTYTGNGGTFQLLWAQNASDSNNLTVKAKSILRYRRIDA